MDRRSLVSLVGVGLALCTATAEGQTRLRLATVAPAVAKPSRPAAQLQIFSSDRLDATWSGKGDNSIGADLCVASNTGRYQLQIMSEQGGVLRGTGQLDYTIHFRDESGITQTKRMNGQALVVFDGVSPDSTGCEKGPNASIEIESAAADLKAQIAGDYADRLVLSATPL